MSNTREQDEAAIIKLAMTILGGRTSPKKKISSRLNAMKPRKKKVKSEEGDLNAQRRRRKRRATKVVASI